VCCFMMTERRKLSAQLPADNPEYFNLSDWEGIGGDGSSQADTNQSIIANLGDLDPPREVFESLVSIEKLTEKNNSKAKKKRLGSSLRRLFSGSSRRNSGTGLENEYLPAPSTPNDIPKSFGSLPSTPTKTPQNPFFRQNSESRSLRSTLTRQLSNPVSPSSSTEEGTTCSSPSYYNTQNKAKALKPGKSPVKHSKPPPCPGKLNKTLVHSPLKTAVLNRVRTKSSSSSGREGVPGMEAPPLPILHSVCRGFVEEEMPRIVILYSGGCNDSRKWRDYLAKVLEMRDDERDKGKVVGQRVEEFSETGGLFIREESRRCEELVYHCSLVLVIISRKFTQWLDKTGIILGKIINPNRVVGLRLGVSPTDITPATTTSLQHFPKWRVVEIGGDEDSDFTIGQYCQEILAKHQQNTSQPEEPKFKVFPRKVSPGQSKVQLVMDDMIDKSEREQFELLISLDDKKYSVEDAKWVKDDLAQVEIPSSLFQSTLIAVVVLRLNGRSFGSRQLKIENAATVLESAWQVCTDPVTILSDAFDVRFISNQDIDEFLSASLEKKLSISDLLKMRHRQETREDSFMRDHSNLIHFAAKHGFGRVCQTLLSLGYDKYLTVPNILGLTPPECAEKSGYHSLAQELKGNLPAQHEYQYPGLGCVEGEDGYLLPSNSPDQQVPEIESSNVLHEYQVPNTPLPPKYADLFPPKLVPIQEKSPESDFKTVSQLVPKEDPSNFYQVPPSPVPVSVPVPEISKICPSSDSPSDSSSTISISPTRLCATSYLPMEPPMLRKAMSEPKQSPRFTIPKSSSFSHFSGSYSDKVLAQGPIPPAMSREELIRTFCQDTPQSRPGSTPPSLQSENLDQTPTVRPESTPPDIEYCAVTSSAIGIPARKQNNVHQSGESPLEHHVHIDTGLVYLPIENHDSDSEITSYYESGKITEQEMNSHRKESSDVEDVGKSKVISLSLESGDVGKVMKMLGRLSPSRSKFNMGSLRRRKGSKAGPTFDDNENVIEVVHSSDKKLCLDNLGNSVLNLSNTRSSSLKNISTPLPPKTSLHSKTLPNSGMVSKMPISSLYDIPRDLSNKDDYIMPLNSNVEAYINAEDPNKRRVMIIPQNLSVGKKPSRKLSSSCLVKNSNEGAYENVKIIPIAKEK